MPHIVTNAGTGTPEPAHATRGCRWFGNAPTVSSGTSSAGMRAAISRTAVVVFRRDPFAGPAPGAQPLGDARARSARGVVHVGGNEKPSFQEQLVELDRKVARPDLQPAPVSPVKADPSPLGSLKFIRVSIVSTSVEPLATRASKSTWIEQFDSRFSTTQAPGSPPISPRSMMGLPARWETCLAQ
jgi:hypothetical protein